MPKTAISPPIKSGLLTVCLNRDSVCSGDDMLPHTEQHQEPSAESIAVILKKLAHNYLPSVAGKAYWLVAIEKNGKCSQAVAVIENHCVMELSVHPEMPLSAWAHDGTVKIFAQYFADTLPELPDYRAPKT